MKSTLRIPTRQYAYIEVEFEGTEKEIMDKYFELESEYRAHADEYNKKRNEEPPFEDDHYAKK